MATNTSNDPYRGYEPYDVCQVLIGDEWLDYATIRNESDASYAVALVSQYSGRYRIVCKGTIKLK